MPLPESAYPLAAGKDYQAKSLFRPEHLLREARRQKQLSQAGVPAVALLDPDGDIVRFLMRTGRGHKHQGWACYHTDMWVTDLDGLEIAVVGCAVGAPFAVLVAEQLAVSGAQLVVSITSAGQIRAPDTLPCFVLIERALRDEGTSAHYLPPGKWSHLGPAVAARLSKALQDFTPAVFTGASWTTDAPYRETQTAIDAAVGEGVACVEMEAAGLYAYATARGRLVVCLAHITNTMATSGDDFEKGANDGADSSLSVVQAVAAALGFHPAQR
jgi:uridine phosphorylase